LRIEHHAGAILDGESTQAQGRLRLQRLQAQEGAAAGRAKSISDEFRPKRLLATALSLEINPVGTKGRLSCTAQRNTAGQLIRVANNEKARTSQDVRAFSSHAAKCWGRQPWSDLWLASD
jgi:hypothetical protein